MNFIETLNSILESAETTYDERDSKIDVYCEAVMDRLNIDRKKAQLYVMKENGTDEDLAYLEDGALAEAGEKIAEAIKAIIENLKNFVRELKIKAMSMISKAETKKAIEAIDKKAKFNPFIRKKTVEVENHDKKFKALEELLADAKKLLARIKAGRNVDAEDVDMVSEKIEKRVTEKYGTVKMTVENALAALKKQSDNLGNRIDDVYKKNIQPLLDEAKELADKAGLESTTALKKLASTISRIGSKMTSILFQAWTSLFSGIRETLAGIKEKIVDKLSKSDENEVEESVKEEAVQNNAPASDPTEETPDEPSKDAKNDKATPAEVKQESAEEDYLATLEKELFGNL